LSGIFFGIFPVLRLRGVNVAEVLQEGGRGASGSRSRQRVRGTLVAAQVALALVLLVGSGLMMRSFRSLRAVAPGFVAPEEVLTFRLAIPAAEIEEPAAVARSFERILARVGELPAVAQASASTCLPMEGNDSNDALFVEEFPTPKGQLPPIRRFKMIAGDYFATLGTPLVAGRTIEWRDINERRRVVVISENMAREYWHEPEAAIGKRVGTFDIDSEGSLDANESWHEIVGVVGNERDDGLRREAPAVVYWPLAIDSFWGEEVWVPRAVSFAVRGKGPIAGLLEEVRREVWSVSPNLPLANVQTLADIYERSLASTSFALVMLGIAAAAALFLGGVGIYGVISYLISLRTREIGVRLALGARPRDVSVMVVRYGLLLAVVGSSIGLLAAFALTRSMAALLHGVSAHDPLTFLLVFLGVLSAAALASWIAGRRAAGIDPIEALRAE
jgi:predicted permease